MFSLNKEYVKRCLFVIFFFFKERNFVNRYLYFLFFIKKVFNSIVEFDVFFILNFINVIYLNLLFIFIKIKNKILF